MGRPIRIQQPNLIYHIYSRCINCENLMEDEIIKEIIIEVIRETQEKYAFELNSFDILDNHFHFEIKTISGGEKIAKIMQRIKSVFAKRYNKLMNRTGPFWNERYGSRIIEIIKEKLADLVNLLWYQAYNSVRKRKVKDPRDYKYSSINCYLIENYKCKLKIVLSDAFLALGDIFEERVKVFLLYEDEYKKRLICKK